MLFVVCEREDEKWRRKSSKGLIKEVATELGLGAGKSPAGGKERGLREPGERRHPRETR